jgi:hypothetical protein
VNRIGDNILRFQSGDYEGCCRQGCCSLSSYGATRRNILEDSILQNWMSMKINTCYFNDVVMRKLQHANELRGRVLSPRANYADWATATGRRNLVATSAIEGVSRGQSGGSSTVVNLSFLDRSRYFSFKQLLIYPHEAEWAPFQTYYWS